MTDDQFTKILLSLKREANKKYKIQRKAKIEKRKKNRVFNGFKQLQKIEKNIENEENEDGFRMACQRKNLLTINKMIRNTEQDTNIFVK